MKQEFTVPEKTVSFDTQFITFDLKAKTAFIKTQKYDDDNNNETKKVTVNILQMLSDEYTAAEITAIKKFFKDLVAKGWGVDAAEITEIPFVKKELIEEETME